MVNKYCFAIARLSTSVVALSLAVLASCIRYTPAPLAEAPTSAQLLQVIPAAKHCQISPTVAAAWAVIGNADLRAMRTRMQVAAAQVFAAGLLPDPQIALTSDFPYNMAGFVQAYNIGSSLDIGALFVRGKQVRIARQQADQVHRDVAWSEYLMAAQARLQATRIAALAPQFALAQTTVMQLQASLAIAEEALRKGDARLDDVTLRRASLIDARTRAADLERQLGEARHMLNHLLGVTPESRIDILAEPHGDADPVALNDITAQAIHDRLDLAALRAGYASAETSVARAILGQYPRVTLGYTNIRDTSDVRTNGLTINFDLPVWNRNRGGIAIAKATRAQLKAEYEARLVQTNAEIAAARTEQQRLRMQRARLLQDLPTLIVAEQKLSNAYARGAISLLIFEPIRASLIDKQLALMALDQAIAENDIALDIARGARLPSARGQCEA